MGCGNVSPNSGVCVCVIAKRGVDQTQREGDPEEGPSGEGGV